VQPDHNRQKTKGNIFMQPEPGCRITSPQEWPKHVGCQNPSIRGGGGNSTLRPPVLCFEC